MRGFNLATLITWAGTLAIIYLAIFESAVLIDPMKVGIPDAYICSFIKFFILGTLGEILGLYNIEKCWNLDRWFSRSFVWGLFGIWIAGAFKVFALGVDGAIEANYFFNWGPIFTALTKSFWINFLGGYAFFMMSMHDYFNRIIKSGWRDWSVKAFFQEHPWGERGPFLMALIVGFWVLAHFVTFMMPPEWAVLIAAGYSVILGYTISIKKALTQRAIS